MWSNGNHLIFLFLEVVNSSIYGCEYLHHKKDISVVAKKDVNAFTYVYLDDS